MSNKESKTMSKFPLPRLKLLDSSLRISAIPLSVASSWLTVTNREDNSDYGSLVFSSFIGLKYMVFIAAVASGYALLAILSSWVRCLVLKAWVFFYLRSGSNLNSSLLWEKVMAYLMVTAGAAAVETLYLAYKGDAEITWSEACNSYGRFCSKLKMALILHFLALCCFLALAVISAYRAFSLFEPPVPINQAEEERT